MENWIMEKTLLIPEEEHYTLKNLSAKYKKKIRELVIEALHDLKVKYDGES
jgi:hypothetical protein